MSEHAAYAAGLRELADWIEAHPEIALPEKEIRVYTMNEREEAAAVLRALKPCRKEYSEKMFDIKRDFGAVTLNFIFYRHRVCRARVVGQKEIPEVREPAKTIEIPEKIIPAHTEDVIEWDCTEGLLEVPSETEAA